MIYPATYNITILQNATWRGSFRPWEEYCEASLDLSNQDDVGDPQAPLDLQSNSPRSNVIDGS